MLLLNELIKICGLTLMIRFSLISLNEILKKINLARIKIGGDYDNWNEYFK